MSEKKVAVITGAGRGLGRELAKVFWDNGFNVAAVGRDRKGLEQAKEYAAAGVGFSICVADVSNYQQVESAFKAITEEHGRIDILFNNAAVYPKINFLDESADAWNSAMEINVGGVINCCKVVLPAMLEKNYGRIYNIGSWAHLGPIESSAVYSASKGCVHSLTKAIATDIAVQGKNVQVNEWIPGHLNTRMSDFTGIDPAVAAQWGYEISQLDIAASESLTFEQNRQWLPPKSLKQRVLDRILFWKKV